jgi:putative transposase
LRYVECNPVRADLVRDALDYRWSSARAHIAEKGESRLLNLPKWRSQIEPPNWKQVLDRAQATDEVERLRRNTQTGRPLGNAAFVEAARGISRRALGAK